MNVPNILSPEWSDLLEGKNKAPLEFLATRILVSQLMLKYKHDPTPENKTECIIELIDFFKRNLSFPAAQSDLNNIFGGKIS